MNQNDDQPGMPGGADPGEAGPAGPPDARPRAYGAGRVLVLVYAILALAAVSRSLYQLLTKAEQAPLAYTLSALAAGIYLLATLALAHNGKRMRRIAWVAVTIEAIGVVVVGAWSMMRPSDFPDATVWSQFGQGYGYVPLLLPFLGIAWLRRSDPARLARRESTTR